MRNVEVPTLANNRLFCHQLIKTMGSIPYFVGPVESEYIMNQYEFMKYSLVDEQTETNLNEATKIEPSMEIKPPTVPNCGLPISAKQLRNRIEALENTVYVPAIVNGALYFVSQDNDTRTAKDTENVSEAQISDTSINQQNVQKSKSNEDMNKLKEALQILSQLNYQKLHNQYGEIFSMKSTREDLLELKNALNKVLFSVFLFFSSFIFCLTLI
uniref:WASH_WAHD domain-containing protein n=1 Tax=Heterorhabditis bacteriophora TaxID=37862 RepID=A0A1I7XIA2_HETBA